MIFGLSTSMFLTIVILGLGIVAIAGIYAYDRRYGQTGEIFNKLESDKGHVFEMKPAPVGKGYFGWRHLKKWNRERKKKQALKKGYVRWHLIGDSISEEKLVKPVRKKGGNIAEVEFDGGTYLFKEDCMIPSAEDGVYVAMHRVGEEEPIDLRGENEFAIGSNVLCEYLTLRVTATSPGLGIPGLGNLSTKQLMTYGVMAFIGFVVIMEFLG